MEYCTGTFVVNGVVPPSEDVIVFTHSQTPAEHIAPALQATVVPHVPLELHVCTPLPTHWTAPGLHGVHTPLVQAMFGATQVSQVLPKAPQLFTLIVVTHWSPEVPPQHPPGHVFESHVHVPLVVSHSPLVQAEQVLPPEPHVLGFSDAHGTQSPVLLSQQPFMQEFVSQTHAPALHSSPEPEPPQLRPFATGAQLLVVTTGWQLSQAFVGSAVPGVKNVPPM
jgi:hypothetical protein